MRLNNSPSPLTSACSLGVTKLLAKLFWCGQHDGIDTTTKYRFFSHDCPPSPRVLTPLLPGAVWVTCPYTQLDGQFNPDVRIVNNTGAFDAMSDAVLYNALAWAINGSSVYASNVASWVNTWFLANDTYMNPNLNYAQVQRGPGPTSSTGTHTGVLDLKCMVKVVNAVLVLRAGGAPQWTSEIDTGLVTWTKSYIGWLTSNSIALGEAAATKCVTLMPILPPSRDASYGLRPAC